jgi:phospholipid/cholesterol/gamma-HCH transport system substrate-binding protein
MPTSPSRTEQAPAAPAAPDPERRAQLKAGGFVVGAIAATVLVLVILGNAHRVFERHTRYVVHFTDVDGLMVDSPVRLGGLTVGSIDAIAFSPTLEDTRVEVRLHVSNEFIGRIRGDSVARVASRGLLGDKTVDISLGSDEGEAIAAGAELTAGAGSDVASVLKSATEVVGNAVSISNDLRRAVALYTDPRIGDEVTGVVENLHAILSEVATGKGALHAIIYDPQTGAELTALVASAGRTARRLDGAVTRVDGILAEIEGGQGSVHALLYGPEGKQALAELGGAAAEVATLLRDVKSSKNAAVHELVYGDSKALVADLSTAAGSLKSITGRVDRGEGSLGALVNDPTAYEDLKTILGNVKRNRLLRELVRLTVSNRSEYATTGTPEALPTTEAPLTTEAPPAPEATR